MPNYNSLSGKYNILKNGNQLAIFIYISVAASPLINEARRTSCAIVGTDCSTLPCCEDLTCARTPKLLCIYG
ncbi:hypothetical protein RIR_jg20088.t1 [Rhizophagus irregularis DAOM 181602=DAOM 197198]|nr:hypothetical protein RIR_jg20088.t1 [Rhizophagus irregularis DAOM 181602=DAOM 197198]